MINTIVSLKVMAGNACAHLTSSYLGDVNLVHDFETEIKAVYF